MIDEFGHGIVCPFQRDGKGDFANTEGLDLLKSDIGELIGIIGPTPGRAGELPWNTEIGSTVTLLKHRGLNSELFRATAEQFIYGPVRTYEDRARPGKTEITKDFETGTATIRFSYYPVGRLDATDYVEISTEES